MDTVGEGERDNEYTIIREKGQLGYIDHEEEKSLQNFDPLEEGPLKISIPFPFIKGKPQSALIGETSASEINIKNTTDDPIELWSVRIYSSLPEDSFMLSVMKPPLNEEESSGFVGMTSLEERVVQPGQTLTIWISCKPKEIGMHTSAVHFDAGEKIERLAFLLAEDKVSQALFSNKPYIRTHSQVRKAANYNGYVGVSRPPRTDGQGRRPFNLPQFAIPNDLREIIENKQVPNVIMDGLNEGNYCKYFTTLIVMEEIKLEEDMRAHDMDCVSMRMRSNQFLSLEVPGLAERRPSLVCRDYIFARYTSDELNNDKRAYQGFIHKVEADEIFLVFDKTFHQNHQECNLYNVTFTYNRLSMRRLYHAIGAAENMGPELLFPSYIPKKRYIRTNRLKPLNQNLNQEQARSVEKILGCRGAPPYVIHGPPGTGKTITLIETMLQVYSTMRNTRILVCASSNSAADYVLEKLVSNDMITVRENEIFRLNAVSRPYEDVKPDLLQFCFYDEDMVFKCPPIKALLHYRIIVSTYMSASLTYCEGIRRGHFSHIILDEAGQASEPETMIPISNLCTRQTVIVLAGDPMQLGPVIFSRTAENRGLGKSYMERLFECEYYKRGDDNYITKLVRNYRCHPAILELPSDLFYNKELLPCKEESDYFDYESLDIPNKSFPVYFIGVQGCDEREGNNPSWFNRTEASKVVETIRKLIKTSNITEGDIGIITPYRQQVLKLKKALELLEMPHIKVGTVEQFQGQEREVIIISTVRSTVKHNEFDRAHNLGFLTNPRRFNVAITRAKSLLVIIGNPHVISKDPYWDNLLRYCVENNSYQGCPLPPQAQNLDNQNDMYNNQNNSNEADWTEQVQNQFSNQTEWNSSSNDQYQNGNEWGACANYQHQNENEWNDHAPKQYTNEVEWNDSVAEHYSNDNVASDEIRRLNGLELDEKPTESSHEVECGESKNVVQPCNDGRTYWGDIKIIPTGWDD